MMILRIKIHAAAMLILGCPVTHNLNAQEQTTGIGEVRNGGVSFRYGADDFAGVRIKKEQKQTTSENGDAVDEGFTPEHFCFYLNDKRPLPALDQGPRSFIPAHSFICVIPLMNSSVRHFCRACPRLKAAALNLQQMLREHPYKFKSWRDIPDIPASKAGPAIINRFQYLDFCSGSGILFPTRYSNEMLPNPLDNEEPGFDFQGRTKDGIVVTGRVTTRKPNWSGALPGLM